MTAIAAHGAIAAPAEPVNKWLVAVSIAFGSLMATIDSSIVNVALPNIRGELGASIQEITWISTALHDRDGARDAADRLPRRLLRPEARVPDRRWSLFVAGSRAVRHRALAAGAGLLSHPAGPRRRRAAADPAGDPAPDVPAARSRAWRWPCSRWSIMVGPAVGPVLGGWITDNYSWPWIFYINLPVGIIGIMMTVQNVHEPDDVRVANRARAELARKNLDIAGIVLMVDRHRRAPVPVRGGPAGRLVRLDGDPDRRVRVRRRARPAFVIRELTATAPVVNLRLFKDPTFASATVDRVRHVRDADGQHVPPAGVRAGEPALHRDAVGHRADAAHARDDGGVADRRPASTTRCSRRSSSRVGVLLFAIGCWQLSRTSRSRRRRPR